MLEIHIGKLFRAGRKNFRLNLDINVDSSFRRIVFFGPSGSGKTLAMQSIAGLQKPDYGKIMLLGRMLYDSASKVFVPPQKRHIGYLLQDYALFPHLTILQNVAYPHTGLFPRFVPAAEALRATEILERFGIGQIGGNLPSEISGGQKQRASLARALNSGPDILLLDEPFSALDPLMRAHMRGEIQSLLAKMNMPAIIITHDPEDVGAFAGALVLFEDGRAHVVTDWEERRAAYPTIAQALRALLETSPLRAGNQETPAA